MGIYRIFAAHCAVQSRRTTEVLQDEPEAAVLRIMAVITLLQVLCRRGLHRPGGFSDDKLCVENDVLYR